MTFHHRNITPMGAPINSNTRVTYLDTLARNITGILDPFNTLTYPQHIHIDAFSKITVTYGKKGVKIISLQDGNRYDLDLTASVARQLAEELIHLARQPGTGGIDLRDLVQKLS